MSTTIQVDGLRELVEAARPFRDTIRAITAGANGPAPNHADVLIKLGNVRALVSALDRVDPDAQQRGIRPEDWENRRLAKIAMLEGQFNLMPSTRGSTARAMYCPELRRRFCRVRDAADFVGYTQQAIGKAAAEGRRIIPKIRSKGLTEAMMKYGVTFKYLDQMEAEDDHRR